MRKHWYQIHFEDCPVCGRSSKTRTRVYGKKPKKIKSRYSYGDLSCNCIYFD